MKNLTKLIAMSLAVLARSVSSQTHKCRLMWNVVASLQSGLSSFFSGFHSDCVCVEWFLAVVLMPPTLPSLSPLPLIHQCDRWLGCGDLPAMGAVFYLGAGWPQWRPPGYPRQPLSI